MPTEEQTYRESVGETLGRIEKNMKAGFDGVYDRQDHTNGRVRALEVWRGVILGGLAVITTLIVPIVIYILTKSV